jgi:hypothetical protein
MKKQTFTIQGKVWRYPGPAGWMFIYVDDSQSRMVRESKQKRVGFGFVPVQACIGKTCWKTTLFPTKEGPYLLSIKAAVRAKEGIFEGDEVSVRVEFAG